MSEKILFFTKNTLFLIFSFAVPKSVNGLLFSLVFFMFWNAYAQPTLYLIGDSTLADKKDPEVNPEHGWGQVLPTYFNPPLRIENHAVNGRSSKSFFEKGRWEVILNQLKKGDFVLIQFGHNDAKIKDSTRFTNPATSYRNNLLRYVKETRSKRATPILATAIVRRNFNEDGVLVDTHGLYPIVVRMLAADQTVALVDLQLHTEQLEYEAGVEGSKKLHLHFEKGEHPYYPEGKIDNTHLSSYGAHRVAKAAVAEFQKLGLLTTYIKPISPIEE